MDNMHGMLGYLEKLSALFILFLGLGVIAIIYMYIVDKTQNKQAIRRNYPVIGRFRYFFEKQGEFFRQYFLDNIFSRWTEKSFPLTVRNEAGFTEPQKMLTVPLHLALHETLNLRAPSCL